MANWKYIGGDRSLVGYPARDLTGEEVEAMGLDEAVLRESGLYEQVGPRRQRDADDERGEKGSA